MHVPLKFIIFYTAKTWKATLQTARHTTKNNNNTRQSPSSPSHCTAMASTTEQAHQQAFAKLNTGALMPQVGECWLIPDPPPRVVCNLHLCCIIGYSGLGTWKAAPGEVAAAVTTALRNGYRHLGKLSLSMLILSEHSPIEIINSLSLSLKSSFLCLFVSLW